MDSKSDVLSDSLLLEFAKATLHMMERLKIPYPQTNEEIQAAIAFSKKAAGCECCGAIADPDQTRPNGMTVFQPAFCGAKLCHDCEASGMHRRRCESCGRRSGMILFFR